MENDPYIRKAYDAILRQDYEQAADWFSLAVAREPDNASHHYRFSITLARSDKWQRALEHAEKAARLDPDVPAYRLHLNRLLARRLLFEAEGLLAEKEGSGATAAIGRLTQATALDPLSVEAWLMLAEACRRAGRLAAARRAVRNALKLNPAHREAGALYGELQHPDDRV